MNRDELALALAKGSKSFDDSSQPTPEAKAESDATVDSAMNSGAAVGKALAAPGPSLAMNQPSTGGPSLLDQVPSNNSMNIMNAAAQLMNHNEAGDGHEDPSCPHCGNQLASNDSQLPHVDKFSQDYIPEPEPSGKPGMDPVKAKQIQQGFNQASG